VHFDAGGGKPSHVEVGFSVDRDDVHSARNECRRRGLPRAREAEHEDARGQRH
jgi:hypothetical protein